MKTMVDVVEPVAPPNEKLLVVVDFSSSINSNCSFKRVKEKRENKRNSR